MKTKLITYISLLLVGLVVAGYFLFIRNGDSEVKYRTEKITRGDVLLQVRATGIVNPTITVQVGSQVSGIVAKLYADFNSIVKKGQVIGQIDSTFLYASVREAEANLERAGAQVNEARRSRVRSEELLKKELISQAEYDAAQTSFETAQAQAKQAEAALERARVNLRYSVIRAPIDGVVISRDVDVGQTVAASLQAPKLFTIANDLTRMQVEASVDEADIGQIKEGQDVTFSVDAYPEIEFRGVVIQVRLAPTNVQNVVTYIVIIGVANTDLKLRPGMTATVSILIDKREDVLRIPALALRFQPSSEILEKFAESEKVNGDKQNGGGRGNREKSGADNKGDRKGGPDGEPRAKDKQRSEGKPGHRGNVRPTRIWILENGTNLKPFVIKTGLNNNRFIEITDGELKEGDEVIVAAMTTEGGPAGSQQQNPFAPRLPGGGGGPRRGGF